MVARSIISGNPVDNPLIKDVQPPFTPFGYFLEFSF